MTKGELIKQLAEICDDDTELFIIVADLGKGDNEVYPLNLVDVTSSKVVLGSTDFLC